jgi:hypothetical protein
MALELYNKLAKKFEMANPKQLQVLDGVVFD